MSEAFKRQQTIDILETLNINLYKNYKGEINRTELAREIAKSMPNSGVDAIRQVVNKYFAEKGDPFKNGAIPRDKILEGNQSFLITDPKEIEIIQTYRDGVSVLKKECIEAKIDYNDVKHWWYKTKKLSVFVKQNKFDLEALKNALVEELKVHSPKYPTIKRTKIKDSCCLVVDIADLHINKLANNYETGNTYNSKIAVQRAKEGLRNLLNYSFNFSFDKIVFVIGNDILHTDNKLGSTTKGTHQDTEKMWYEAFLIAKQLYVDCIEMLIPIADVHVMHNMSNHDNMSGWFLAQTIEAWFRNSKNVSFDITTRHRKGFHYYNQLIVTTHGDGAKEKDLGLLLANDFRKVWADIKWVYVYKGDIHHKTVKDYSGVTVTTSRSASGTDAWHDKQGFAHNKKAIESYVHHKTKGQVASFAYSFFD